jgi:cytochrome c biogenesis protein CcdA
MFGLDDWLIGLGGNNAMAFLVAVLLGLRHATDPDHLTAVSTLVLSDEHNGTRRAASLGLAWGLGHAATLVAFGLPVVLFSRHLPQVLLQGAEVAIGIVIIFLALRLLSRWTRGQYHTHPHVHDGVLHAHPHVHEHEHPGDVIHHSHLHAPGLGRSPVAAFGIGMVHGLGGSAGVGILVVGAASNTTEGVASLVRFAAGTAVSMAVVSTAFGYALTQRPVAQRVSSVVPLLALASLAFGAWYALGAMRGPVTGL